MIIKSRKIEHFLVAWVPKNNQSIKSAWNYSTQIFRAVRAWKSIQYDHMYVKKLKKKHGYLSNNPRTMSISCVYMLNKSYEKFAERRASQLYTHIYKQSSKNKISDKQFSFIARSGRLLCYSTSIAQQRQCELYLPIAITTNYYSQVM